MSKSTVYKLVTIIFLFLASFVLRLLALNQTPNANGWDGYYYLMQVYTFYQNGAMRAPDSSLIYPFYIAIAFFIKDITLAFKAGSAILAGIYTITIYLFGLHFIKGKSAKYTENQTIIIHQNNELLALLIATFSLFSPTLTYFTAQFPKNLLGLIFFLWFLYFISKEELIYAGLLFVLAYFTHRSTAGLSFIVLPVFVFRKQYFGVFVLLMVAMALFATFFSPGILHISDIERIKDLRNFNFPTLEFIRFFGFNKLTFFWLSEIILVFIVFIIFAIYHIYSYLKYHNLSKLYLSFLLALLVLILPVYQFNRADLGFRFYLVFSVLSIVLCSVLGDFVKRPIVIKIVIVAFFIMSLFSYKSYNPKDLDPPYSDYFQVIAATEKTLGEEEPDILIAHQGLAQMLIIYTKYNATNWQPMDTSNYQSMWRIVPNIKYYYFKKYLNETSLSYLKPSYKDYYLIREDSWQEFKNRVKNTDNEALKQKITDWYNPSEIKPEYLLKGRDKDYIH